MEQIVDPCLTADEQRLRDLISDMSETAYYAGWMNDAEFDVWRLAYERGTWGHATAAELDVRLRAATALANHLDRWIVWSEDSGCDNKAVPLPEWTRLYASWRDNHPGDAR